MFNVCENGQSRCAPALLKGAIELITKGDTRVLCVARTAFRLRSLEYGSSTSSSETCRVGHGQNELMVFCEWQYSREFALCSSWDRNVPGCAEYLWAP